LNNLRRLAKFHSAILKKNNFHAIVGEAVKLIESLRSGVSKNSLMTIYELSNLYKKELDTEVLKSFKPY
jgi:hypothetical protein